VKAANSKTTSWQRTGDS